MFRLYALTLAAFAIGISEFVLVGLLPSVAADTDTNLPTAGMLVTAYALAIAVGSPLLTSWTSRHDSRVMLTALMTLFAVGNVVVALSPSFAGLLAGRLLAGAAHGTIFALGAPLAASLVPREKAAQAVSLMFAGLTAAMVIGVPLGAAIGTELGWRASFWIIAALGLLAAVGISVLIPRQAPSGSAVSLVEQIRLLRTPTVLLTLLTTAAGFGATFAVFTFLEPLLTEHAGFDSSGVTWMLVLFGAATIVGNLTGGRLSDRLGTIIVIRMALVGLAATFAALLLTKDSPIALAVNLAVWGFFAFLISPAVQTHTVLLAEAHGAGAQKAASGLNVAAFNIGIASASALGGLLLTHADVSATPWIAIGFVAIALFASLGIMAKATAKTSAGTQPARPKVLTLSKD